MKKLLLALCVFAACKAPGSKPGNNDVRQVEAAPTGQTSVAPTTGTTAVNPVMEKDVAKVAGKPAKKITPTSSATFVEIESAVTEARQEQKIADSIQNAQQGSGSDMEGFIPFIKQFYDR